MSFRLDQPLSDDKRVIPPLKKILFLVYAAVKSKYPIKVKILVTSSIMFITYFHIII